MLSMDMEKGIMKLLKQNIKKVSVILIILIRYLIKMGSQYLDMILMY